MKTTTIVCLIAIILMLLIAIIIPPMTGIPLTKSDSIVITVSIGIWILVFIICISKDSVDYECEIDDLKNRVRELENKLNNARGKDDQ